jgi:cell division protein FtsL
MREAVRKFKETVEIKSTKFNKIKSHRYFPMAVLLTLLLTGACIHIWQRVKVVSLVKEIAQLKHENESLLDDKKKLYSEIAALTTASRIGQFATDTLGMKSIPAERLLTLIPNDQKMNRPDDLALLLNAIKRVVDYMPVIEETRASATGVENLNLDSLELGWGD